MVLLLLLLLNPFLSLLSLSPFPFLFDQAYSVFLSFFFIIPLSCANCSALE